TFVPNENYPLRADGNDVVTGLEFNIYGDINTMQLALQNNDIDIMAPVVPASALGNLEQQSNIEIATSETALNYTKLTFNSAPGKFFEDPEIRAAVAGLIDTEAIIGAVLQGNGVQGTSPVIPALTDYQPDVQQHESDAEEVKALL